MIDLTKKPETKYLKQAQEELDYWLSEGGTIEKLEQKIDLRIDLHMDRAIIWKHVPASALASLEYVQMFLRAKQELELLKEDK